MKGFFSKNQFSFYFVLTVVFVNLLPLVFDIAGKGDGYATRLMLGMNRSSGSFVNHIKDKTSYYWNHYIHLSDTSIENSLLKKQLQEMESQSFLLEELRLENNRLKTLLDYKNSTTAKTSMAKVTGGSPSVVEPGFLIIDKGESDGISKGAPVMSNSKVIGTVYSVNAKNSMVMLMTNPFSVVDAIVQRTRLRGIVTGAGNNYIMKYIDPEGDIVAGDKIISSGKDAVFPKSAVIGTVTRVEKINGGLKKALIKPEIDIGEIEEVLVVMPTRKELAKTHPDINIRQ